MAFYYCASLEEHWCRFCHKNIYIWLDWTCFSILMHPPWSQGVNFDALITFCACSTQNGPQAEKMVHMQFPIALKLFKKRF